MSIYIYVVWAIRTARVIRAIKIIEMAKFQPVFICTLITLITLGKVQNSRRNIHDDTTILVVVFNDGTDNQAEGSENQTTAPGPVTGQAAKYRLPSSVGLNKMREAGLAEEGKPVTF